MRVARPIVLIPEQKEALERCARARSLPVRLVERARIVLPADAGKQDQDIAAELEITAHKAARWRKRFLATGMAGLEKDAPRPGRTPRISAVQVKRVIDKTTQEKPTHATQWSTRSMYVLPNRPLSDLAIRQLLLNPLPDAMGRMPLLRGALDRLRAPHPRTRPPFSTSIGAALSSSAASAARFRSPRAPCADAHPASGPRPAIVPTPNSYSRRICSNNSTLALQSNESPLLRASPDSEYPFAKEVGQNKMPNWARSEYRNQIRCGRAPQDEQEEIAPVRIAPALLSVRG